ncbi:7281_t:CDS:1, partial [Gigaspora rosea]
RTAKDNFKFEDAEINSKKVELEQKIADLEAKLAQSLEDQNQTDNSNHENEKKDLEKKLWDLRMDNLTKNHLPIRKIIINLFRREKN